MIVSHNIYDTFQLLLVAKFVTATYIYKSQGFETTCIQVPKCFSGKKSQHLSGDRPHTPQAPVRKEVGRILSRVMKHKLDLALVYTLLPH